MPQLRNYAADLNSSSLSPVLVELPPLLSETDLHIAQLTMNLLTTVAKLHKGSLPEVQSNSLPEIFRLAQSPLLQVSPLAHCLLEQCLILFAFRVEGLRKL